MPTFTSRIGASARYRADAIRMSTWTGIYQRRNRGGKYENVAILVAIAVNKDGFHEVLGATEGMKG